MSKILYDLNPEVFNFRAGWYTEHTDTYTAIDRYIVADDAIYVFPEIEKQNMDLGIALHYVEQQLDAMAPVRR